MRRDQYPDKPCFKDSGLPTPSKGALWISLISALIRCKILLSERCQ